MVYSNSIFSKKALLATSSLDIQSTYDTYYNSVKTDVISIVDMVSDGNMAFNKLMTNTYDIAVIDLIMPEIDGISVVRKLKNEGVSIPNIIMPSAATLERYIIDAMDEGIYYIVYPFTFDTLNLLFYYLRNDNLRCIISSFINDAKILGKEDCLHNAHDTIETHRDDVVYTYDCLWNNMMSLIKDFDLNSQFDEEVLANYIQEISKLVLHGSKIS